MMIEDTLMSHLKIITEVSDLLKKYLVVKFFYVSILVTTVVVLDKLTKTLLYLKVT